MEDPRAPEPFALAHDATVSSVAEALDAGRTPRQAAEIARGVARLLDGMLGRLDRENPPACRPKCAWCCYLRVACTPPEAIAVAAYVQAELNKRDRRALALRLEAFASQRDSPSASARPRPHPPCPFLADDVCLVHPARTLACRGWHSFDVGQCKRHWENPAAQVEASGARLALRGVVSSAMREGLRRGGLNGETVELAAAVRLILSDRDVVTAWLRGEDAFAAVRWQG